MAIYFIQAGKGGPIKIGFTARPLSKSRISSIQTANHETITVLAMVPGGRGREDALHARFWEFHRAGEWFSPHPKILRYIASLPPFDMAKARVSRTRGWRKMKASERRKLKAIWFDMRIQTDVEAARRMGMATSTIKQNLGPSGRSNDPEHTKRVGKKGGLAKAKNRGGKRTPTDIARKHWFDPKYDTNAEALAAINSHGYSYPWGMRAAQLQFGPSGRARGRRSAN